MTRSTALGALVLVEVATVAFVAISLHNALLNASSFGQAAGNPVVLPAITALAMLTAYGALTWAALDRFSDD